MAITRTLFRCAAAMILLEANVALARNDNAAGTVSVAIDTSAAPKAYSPMIFGGFIEHFHRQIYGGIFEPNSPLSDERGFRKDVIAAMKELKLSVVRWPGGCFASGYHWADGVGKTRRPVADPVGGVTDLGAFGTDEFVEWCRRVGCRPYICTNAGNGSPKEMARWAAYCNATGGELAAMRKTNGHDKPHGVPYWSIGNKNWGGHEIGRKTPETWGPMVAECAKLMRRVDPDTAGRRRRAPRLRGRAPILAGLLAAQRHAGLPHVHNALDRAGEHDQRRGRPAGRGRLSRPRQDRVR